MNKGPLPGELNISQVTALVHFVPGYIPDTRINLESPGQQTGKFGQPV